jgi:hypothetical protein
VVEVEEEEVVKEAARVRFEVEAEEEVEAACSVATRVHSVYTDAYLLHQPCAHHFHFQSHFLHYQNYSPPSSFQLPTQPDPR